MAVATAGAAPARARRKTTPKRIHGVPAAFRQLEKVPALTESRDRLLRALLATNPSPDDAVRAIEGDIGLTIAVVRAANAANRSGRRGIAAVPRAVEVLTPVGVEQLARQIPTIDFFERVNDVTAGEIVTAARRVGLDEAQLRSLMHELPGASDRPRVVEECPLSRAELVALRGLASGHTYKALAASLDRSTSTIRTQLHNTYKKLGVRDRAQAVLLAAEHGWL